MKARAINNFGANKLFMATYRPLVSESDNYSQKIIKYIPAEIVAAYIALTGYLAVKPNIAIPSEYKTYYQIVLIVLIVITPVWTYYAVIDGKEPEDPVKRKKKALFHAAIATMAFLIWVYALGNDLLKAIICKCPIPNCDNCPQYSPILGSIFLVLFTVLTPLFERIVFGPKKS
jgi:hypothetical protein